MTVQDSDGEIFFKAHCIAMQKGDLVGALKGTRALARGKYTSIYPYDNQGKSDASNAVNAHCS